MLDNGKNNDTGCKIPLRNRKKEIVGEAICSTCDYDYLVKYKWNSSRGYVVARIDGKTVMMHRYVKIVLEGAVIPPTHVVDHLYNNRFDNRRHMLAVRTVQVNNRNKKKKTDATSIYFGVIYNKHWKKYMATARLGKKILIGSSIDEIEVAKMYDSYLLQNVTDIENSGFKLNFPHLADELRNYKFKESTKHSSIYNYVTYVKANKTFVANVRHDTHYGYIGSGTEIECAKLADAYIVKNALNKKLNFPTDYPEYRILPKIRTLYTDIDDDTIQLVIPSKPDIIAKIDRNMYSKVMYMHLNCTVYGYITWEYNGKMGKLHRFLMDETDPRRLIDHVNGDRADNRMCNLRVVTPTQNAQNKGKSKTATSIYHGVCISSKRDKHGGVLYVGAVKNSEKRTFSRLVKSEEHAARARDLYILQNIPNSHYRMNFVWSEADIETWSNILNYRGPIPNDNRHAKRLKIDEILIQPE